MRRACLVPALLVMLLAVMPGTASAQGGHGAPDFKDRFTDEFVDDDFCGTGASVDVVENTVGNVWGLEGEDFFKLTFRSRLSFTYGDTTIYVQNAGRVDVQRVEGEFPGPRTDLVVETGIRAALRVPGQGVLTLDHGFLSYLVSFDENGDVLSVEVLKDAGGHPAFDSDVFCEAAIDALGIPVP
jgi:hypothetical protein